MHQASHYLLVKHHLPPHLVGLLGGGGSGHQLTLLHAALVSAALGLLVPPLVDGILATVEGSSTPGPHLGPRGIISR